MSIRVAGQMMTGAGLGLVTAMITVRKMHGPDALKPDMITAVVLGIGVLGGAMMVVLWGAGKTKSALITMGASALLLIFAVIAMETRGVTF